MTGTLAFADDVATTITPHSAATISVTLTSYEDIFGLLISIDKTKLLPHTTASPCTFTYRGTPIQIVNFFKYLGAVIQATRKKKKVTRTHLPPSETNLIPRSKHFLNIL
jgi:hypothetical protein